jgi:hypothetical protein
VSGELFVKILLVGIWDAHVDSCFVGKFSSNFFLGSSLNINKDLVEGSITVLGNKLIKEGLGG